VKLRSVALVSVMSVAALGLIGAGAHAVFTTSTTSGQTITAGTWGTVPPPTIPTTPTVAISYPVNDTTYGTDWGGAITGTVSDALGSVTGVGVSLQQGSGSDSCWTGSDSTFTAACPNYVPVTSGTTTWSLTLPTTDLTSGDTYNVTAQAKDSVGNVFTSSTVAFTYNTTAVALPTVAISYPFNGTTYGTNWTGAITGSAAANAAGASISNVVVSIQQVGGSCWSGTADTYTATCPNYLPVTTGTTSWSLTLSSTDFTSGDSYAVTAQATDSDSNVGTSSVVTFSYDTSAPTVAITFPVNGTHYDVTTWTGTITGTASSNSGGSTTIASVSVAIEDTTTSEWWNGSAFASPSQTFVAVSGTTTWSLVVASASLTSGATYSVVAQATDSAENLGKSTPVAFTYCSQTSKVPPTVTITYPVDGTSYGSNWSGEITGTASAAIGASITSVSIAVEDIATKLWWNGTSFSATKQTFEPVTSGTTTWLLTFAASNLTSGHTYSVVAEATDSAGNTGTSETVDFSYCVHAAPPTVTITYPINNTTYGSNWGGEITGTASAGTGASIKSVSVAIEDTATKLWWNGTSFSATSRSFEPVTSGTTTWSLLFGAGNLTSGVTYSVVAKATDSAGNTGTSETVDFTYCVHTAPPTVTITYPVNGTTYGANWGRTITGTASAGTGSTISKVKVSIQQGSSSCWTGSGDTFTASCPSYLAVTSGTTSWTLAVPSTDLTSGDSYKVTAQATDSYENVGTSSTVAFTYNNSPPTVTITYPVNKTTYGTDWAGKITGSSSATSTGSTVQSVKVSIQQGSGSCWTGSGKTYTTSCPNYLAVTSGTTSWSLTIPSTDLTNGDSYSVVAQATDSLGNLGTSLTVAFTYNSSPPSVTITYPVNKTTYGTNWTGKITGTASSNSGASTTIASVSVAIEDTKTGKWWNGSSFSATSQIFVTASGTTSWSLVLAAKYLASSDNYSVIAQATDSLGNVGTSSTITFTYSSWSHG